MFRININLICSSYLKIGLLTQQLIIFQFDNKFKIQIAVTLHKKVFVCSFIREKVVIDTSGIFILFITFGKLDIRCLSYGRFNT